MYLPCSQTLAPLIIRTPVVLVTVLLLFVGPWLGRIWLEQLPKKISLLHVEYTFFLLSFSLPHLIFYSHKKLLEAFQVALWSCLFVLLLFVYIYSNIDATQKFLLIFYNTKIINDSPISANGGCFDFWLQNSHVYNNQLAPFRE